MKKFDKKARNKWKYTYEDSGVYKENQCLITEDISGEEIESSDAMASATREYQ